MVMLAPYMAKIYGEIPSYPLEFEINYRCAHGSFNENMRHYFELMSRWLYEDCVGDNRERIGPSCTLIPSYIG